MAEAYPRTKFRDWNRSMTLFDRGINDTSLEMKQWMSGAPLLSLVIQSALKGVSLRPDSRMQIRDMTAYDDQLAVAVMDINHGGKDLPRTAYVGTVWGGRKSRSIKVDNITNSIREQLLSRQRSCPEVALGSRRPQLPPKPTFDASQKPTYNPDAFKVTAPRTNLDLPILQSIYDKWAAGNEVVTVKGLRSSDPDMQYTFADLTLMHNNEFNVSGVPHKAKREADLALIDLEGAVPPAVQLLPDLTLPNTLEELLAQNLGLKVPGGTTYSMVITKAGGVLLYAEADCTVHHDEALFVIRGTPKTGPAATKVMKDAKAWVEYSLSGTDQIILTFQAPLAGTAMFPTSPQPLNAALKFLEEKGHVRVQLYLHTVERDPAAAGMYRVERSKEEPACMEVDVAKDDTQPLTSANMAKHINIPDLKACIHCKICQRIQFTPSLNKMQPGLPAVYLTGPLTMKKGQLLKLF